MTWLRLEAIELDPGSSYEARLRVQMASPEDDLAEEQHYAGQWSDWSQPVCFPSPQTSARGGGLPPRAPPFPCLSHPPTFSPPWNFLPEAVIPRLTTFPWKSEIFNLPSTGLLGNYSYCLSLGLSVAHQAYASGSGGWAWSHLPRKGWADLCNLLGRVADTDDLADGGGETQG